MKLRPLLTHEIGSLAKPSWKVKAASGKPLANVDFDDLLKWGNRLKISNVDEAMRFLKKPDLSTDSAKAELLELSSLFATRLLESTGIDMVWDGEQHRVEMYEYPVRRISGFVFRGHVRSFDNKYYAKASCIDEPSFKIPFHVEEFQRISRFAQKAVKIPVTGAYTLVDWSFDEHYASALSPGDVGILLAKKTARSAFIQDVATKVIHPNLKALYDAGARFLQIDEPAAATKRNETPEFIRSLQSSIGELAGKAFFSTHICFSDYERLFPALRELEGILNEVHLEYANRDTKELGITAEKRSGYDILHKLKDATFIVGLGVIDVHTDFIEPPELIRDRILYACNIIKDPSRIFVAPDCGLRTRTWDVAYQKLENMVLGRDLAFAQLKS